MRKFIAIALLSAGLVTEAMPATASISLPQDPNLVTIKENCDIVGGTWTSLGRNDGAGRPLGRCDV